MGDIVAYLGPEASYSHQAALGAFDKNDYHIEARSTFEDVFEAVQSGAALLGVVPFENSTNGVVTFTLDLLADPENRFPDVSVGREIYLNVHHYLLGRSSDADVLTSDDREPTGALRRSLKHIKVLYSHYQVWGQCQKFLSSHAKGIELVDVSSTSKAAEIAAADSSRTSAAISSSLSAELHDLEFLAQHIEDQADNTTRFFILHRTRHPSPQLELYEPTVPIETCPRFKCLVALSVNRDDPEALANSLAVFKSHQLSLTSINTRPSGIMPWHYIFLIEANAKIEADHADVIERALKNLHLVALSCKWLGSWVPGPTIK